MGHQYPSITPGQKKKGKRQRWKKADLLYDAEVRRYIAGRWKDGRTVPDIAKELKITKREVQAYMDTSLEKLAMLEVTERESSGGAIPSTPPKTTRRKLPPRAGTSDPTSPVVVSGRLADDPAFQQAAYDLRKRALPFNEIALLLGHAEDLCRQAVKNRLAQLEQDELSETSLARRMMLEQLESMIQAITIPATGRKADGSPAEVVYEAIDRMLKLLDQKAKLLGLNAPQKVDITHRIEALAEETGYDVDELRDIAVEVVHRHSSRSLR